MCWCANRRTAQELCHRKRESGKEAEDELSGLLVDASKEFFIQGFLHGIAAAKGGVV